MGVKSKIFIDLCEKNLPSCVKIQGIEYKRWEEVLLGENIFRIFYSEYDGNFFNTKETIIEKWYPDNISSTSTYNPKAYSFQEMIEDCLKTLIDLNAIILEEILSKEDKFRRDLTKLLNGTENASNTPDFILADYLIGCLRNFNNSINRRSEWYGHEFFNDKIKDVIKS